MNILESIRIALEGVWSNKMRSLLTMLGIIIGIAAVITVVAVGQGGRALLMQEMESFGSNLFVIYVPWDSDHPRQADDITLRDVQVLKELIPEIKLMAPSYYTRDEIRGGRINKQVSIQGTNADYSVVRNVNIISGRFMSEDDVQSTRRVAVIDEAFAREMFGSNEAVGKRIHLRNNALWVIGVYRPHESFLSGDQGNNVFIPISLAHNFYGRWVNQLEGQSTERTNVYATVDKAVNLMERRHDAAEGKYTGVTLEQEMQMANQITGVMALIISAIAAISLLVGGIGVMNIMLVSVTERTREIGIRKALGARRRDILTQFLIEAITICLLGGSIGMIVGIGGAFLIAMIAKWPPMVSWVTVMIAFLFSAMVGIFFGIYPANKASKLDPIDALHYE
ncbi:ABC transporter permease [Metallumcola ferriviriculae]|uniref:ABC transporter permease n=1 Tax=Metallumcola ferriviriculae TaxID=3039180 RepID=A0AAU0ULB4_9FIRM|nr:ABC transporter permease [Desulfitibacteraceae bacterium MK1]